jgi:hypothetical protein
LIQPGIIILINSRKKRWGWNLACAGQSDSYRVLVGTPEGKRPLGNLDIDMGLILEYILQT